MRLLIVEDEEQISRPLAKALEKKGFAVDVADDGRKGYEFAAVNEYDCIVLDLNLPEMDGIEVAKRLRKDKVTTSILMLTARSNQHQIWEGFESGSDDYLVKPFDFKELVYRIRAIIKRSSKNKQEILMASGIQLDPLTMIVKKDNNFVKLNNKEFGMLEYLMRNSGRIISTEELLEHVWDVEIDTFTQTVRTNMKTLRKKVDPEKKIIRTYRGKGYAIQP